MGFFAVDLSASYNRVTILSCLRQNAYKTLRQWLSPGYIVKSLQRSAAAAGEAITKALERRSSQRRLADRPRYTSCAVRNPLHRPCIPSVPLHKPNGRSPVSPVDLRSSKELVLSPTNNSYRTVRGSPLFERPSPGRSEAAVVASGIRPSQVRLQASKECIFFS